MSRPAISCRPFGLASLLVLAAGGAFAQPAPARPAAPRASAAQPAPAAPAPGDKQPDPAFEAARTAFEALPEAQRRAVQEALVWTGDYASVDTGAFGRRTYDAIIAYERRTAPSADGVLDAKGLAALLASGRKARDEAGFTLRPDAATGAALGVPARLLVRTQAVPHGTRWQSADGRATLETRAYDPGESDLQATFDRVSAATPDRKVTYKLKRPDFLVVTGETAAGRFYIRYAATPAGLRGFTLGYDKALAPAFDRISVAIANSFDPNPGVAAPTVAAVAPPKPAGGAPTSAAAPSTAQVPTVSFTGIAVAPGRVLTSTAALGTCAAPRIGANPGRIAVRDGALALIEIAGAARPARLPTAPDPVSGAALVVVAAAGAGPAQVSPGEAVSAARLTAPLQPGAAGAPVLDRSGRLVGLVASYPGAPRLVAGIAPPAGFDLVPAAAVSAFLARNGVAPAPAGPEAALTLGEVAAPVAPAILSIACSG